MQKAFLPGKDASYHDAIMAVLGRLYDRAVLFAQSNDRCSDVLVEVKPSDDDTGCCATASPLHARRMARTWHLVFIVFFSSYAQYG
jgi:hypothetical protein